MRSDAIKMRLAMDMVLVVLLVIGLVYARRGQVERTALEALHESLVAEVAELPEGDPALVRIKAMPTGDPTHFSWRLHLPANYQFRLQSRNESSSSNNINSIETIGRVRFRPDETGRLMVFHDFGGSSGLTSIGDSDFGQYIQQHWRDLKVEQLAADKPVALGADEPGVLLRLTLPPALSAAAEREHPNWAAWGLIPVVYELKLGKEAEKKP